MSLRVVKVRFAAAGAVVLRAEQVSVCGGLSSSCGSRCRLAEHTRWGVAPVATTPRCSLAVAFGITDEKRVSVSPAPFLPRALMFCLRKPPTCVLFVVGILCVRVYAYALICEKVVFLLLHRSMFFKHPPTPHKCVCPRLEGAYCADPHPLLSTRVSIAGP